MRLLENGGRAAVIVPDGVLFGSSRAQVEVRKKLIEENRLDAVVSMPSGVFRPYAGVSTAVLVITKGANNAFAGRLRRTHPGSPVIEVVSISQ